MYSACFNPFDPIQDTERLGEASHRLALGEVSTHSIRYRILKERMLDFLLDYWLQVSTHSIRYRILKVREWYFGMNLLQPFQPIRSDTGY